MKYKTNKNGFTLLEVIICVGLISVLVVGLMQVVLAGLGTTKRAGAFNDATYDIGTAIDYGLRDGLLEIAEGIKVKAVKDDVDGNGDVNDADTVRIYIGKDGTVLADQTVIDTERVIYSVGEKKGYSPMETRRMGVIYCFYDN